MLHFLRNMHHLVERWRDQTTETHDINFLSLRSLDDLLGRDHDAKIDDLVVVARKHNTNDVLTYVVNITLHSCHQHSCGSFSNTTVLSLLFFEEWHQVGDGFFHYASALHHLGKKHLAGSEEIANHIHSRHQRSFDHEQRSPVFYPRLFSVFINEINNAFHQCMLQSFFD